MTKVEERIPTGEEIAESLTGFDEIAIEQRFRKSLDKLSATSTLRALAFTLHRRAGMKDPEAYEAAMGATLKAVSEMFADEADDEGKD